MQIFDEFIELGTNLAGVYLTIRPYSLELFFSYKKQSKKCKWSSFSFQSVNLIN